LTSKSETRDEETKMHKTQATFIVAKAKYDEINEARKAAIEPHFHLLENPTDENIVKHTEIEMDIEERLGYPQARSELKKAERQMVDWATTEIKKHPKYDAAKLDNLVDEARSYPHIWEKLVKLCASYSGQ